MLKLLIIITTLFFLIIFYSLAIVRTHWFLGIFPLICIFTRFNIGNIELLLQKFYMLLLLPAFLLVFLYKKIPRIKGTKQTNIYGKKLLPKNISIAFLCFWLLLFITQLINTKGIPSLSTLNFVFGWLWRGALVYFLVYFINKKYKFEFCLKLLILALSIIVILGFVEILLSRNFFILRYEREAFSLALSKHTPLYNPNLLARNIVILFPFAVFGVYYFRKSLLFANFIHFVVVGSIILILSTFSRAGLIAFGIQILFFLFFLRKIIFKKYNFIIPGIGLICSVTGILIGRQLYLRFLDLINILSSPFYAQTTFDIRQRMRAWIASIETIKESPLIGVGLEKMDSYLFAHGASKLLDGKLVIIPPHGGFLFFFVIGGALLFFSLLLLFYVYLNFLVKKSKAINNKTYKFFVQCALISIIGVIICAVSANPFHLNILWFTIGFILSGVRIQEKTEISNLNILR